MSGEEGVDWGSLDFGAVEAEFGADPRDALAKEFGVPLWAWGLYQDCQAARDEAEAAGLDNVMGVEEAAEKFVDEFVRPLEKGKVRVAWDGAKTETPSELRGRATIELNGKAMFDLFMALRVAQDLIEKVGPLALMGAGLNPNMMDALSAGQIARAVATCLMNVACETEDSAFEGTVVDAS